MMSTPLGWTADEIGGRTIVAVHGDLRLDGTPRLRAALLKCLAEQPAALLVDLSEMHPAEPTALAVFTAVVRHAARWPGTPVLFCSPAPATRALLDRGRFGALPVHDSVAEALAVLDEGRTSMRSISDQLLPISGAVRHARNLATEACSAWDLPHLVGPASLVVSELVSNAIEHAGTMMTVSFDRWPRHLNVTVRDGSPELPQLRPLGELVKGHGLVLVKSVASRWGCLPTRDGKAVWATFVTAP